MLCPFLRWHKSSSSAKVINSVIGLDAGVMSKSD